MEKYYSSNVAQYNVLNELPQSYDWIAWRKYNDTKDDGYVNLIQSYIRNADVIASIIRNEFGHRESLSDIYPFLFAVRQSLEMLLKRLALHSTDKNEDDIVNMRHNLDNVLELIKNTIEWTKYDISFNSCKRAVDFINDKDQLIKYPKTTRGLVLDETYMICISDWLHLLHELYRIYVDILEAIV